MHDSRQVCFVNEISSTATESHLKSGDALITQLISVITFLFSLQANEVLLVGHKLTAVEAYERGLVTRVFPAQEFQDRVKIISRVAGLPPMVARFLWTEATTILSSHKATK